mgnify:CR=1 FL=1
MDTQAPNMDEQVAAAVRQAVQAGSQRIEIRLTPRWTSTWTAWALWA